MTGKKGQDVWRGPTPTPRSLIRTGVLNGNNHPALRGFPCKHREGNYSQLKSIVALKSAG